MQIAHVPIEYKSQMSAGASVFLFVCSVKVV